MFDLLARIVTEPLAEKLGATYERDGSVIGTPCHVWRHPKEAA